MSNISKIRRKQIKQIFCNDNNIFIFLQPVSNTQGRINVESKGVFLRQGKTIFNISKRLKPKEPKWWIEIEKGYDYYYNKLKNK